MDRFGINMKKWCREHEKKMETAPSLAEHRERIAFLQHERLVHLIVTVMVVFVELFVVDLVLLHPELGIMPAVVMLLLAVLLGFYFFHYFFLENTVQRWYKMLDEMNVELSNPQKSAEKG